MCVAKSYRGHAIYTGLTLSVTPDGAKSKIDEFSKIAN